MNFDINQAKALLTLAKEIKNLIHPSDYEYAHGLRFVITELERSGVEPYTSKDEDNAWEHRDSPVEGCPHCEEKKTL